MFYTYILTNRWPVIYTGMTNNINRRVEEHKNHINKNSFSSKYNIDNLVYYKDFNTPMEAIIREKQIKNMSRRDKLRLIIQNNPLFEDLSDQLI